MGTDRWEKYKGPCFCGAGEFIVWHCEADHPYAKGPGWFEGRICCDDCKKTLALIQQDNQYVLVEKTEIEIRAEHSHEYFKRREEFLKKAEVKEILNELKKQIDMQPSMAAVVFNILCHGYWDASIISKH